MSADAAIAEPEETQTAACVSSKMHACDLV
jgi:hypothetical protein